MPLKEWHPVFFGKAAEGLGEANRRNRINHTAGLSPVLSAEKDFLRKQQLCEHGSEVFAVACCRGRNVFCGGGLFPDALQGSGIQNFLQNMERGDAVRKGIIQKAVYGVVLIYDVRYDRRKAKQKFRIVLLHIADITLQPGRVLKERKRVVILHEITLCGGSLSSWYAYFFNLCCSFEKKQLKYRRTKSKKDHGMENQMKYFVKTMVLLFAFAGAIYFFGSNMDEVVFSGSSGTTEMAEPQLPIVSLRSDGVTVNPLRGYTTNLELLSLREAMISVEEDQLLELLIEERHTDVRRLQYEVADTTDGREVASGTISAFEKEDGCKVARIRIAEKLTSGREYAVKATLITSESKRVYYYFRLKYYADAQLKEKVDFICTFSDALLSKNEEYVIPFLESTYRGKGTTYAYVDIKDSFFMACWGDLEPVVVSDRELQLSELYSNIAVATLRYMVELTGDSGRERYYVTERYRVTVQNGEKHLLNYERTMEAAFDVRLTSLSQSQFKLGITSDSELTMVANGDSSMLAFVRNRELWQYNLAESRLYRVFSFRSVSADAEVPEAWGNYDQHEISILGMNENGDVSFMVYGYMNRGEYEGKTGILLYQFYRAENRIEEILYLPINETYQRMKEEISSFSYMNASRVFFFMAYNAMYSYNLITKELTVISSAAEEERLVFSRSKGYVAWQETGDYTGIQLLYLESGEQGTIAAPSGEFVRLLGTIDDHMLCGYGKKSDIVRGKDGFLFYPVSLVQICSVEGSVVKNYRKEGYYVADAVISENNIRLLRVIQRGTEGEYEYQEAPDDYILNYDEEKKNPISVVSRATEKMLTEYYISLPSAYSLKKLPEVSETVNTVIEEDTTVRISEFGHSEEEYEVYSFGRIIGIFDSCAEAIALADQKPYVGTVINESGRVIWERGVKYSAFYLPGPGNLTELASETDKLAAMEQKTGKKVLSLRGITLDEALYFVFRGAPVLAMKNEEDAVLITGYNSGSIVYYDLSNGQTKTVSLREAQELFEKAGDIYFSYVQ